MSAHELASPLPEWRISHADHLPPPCAADPWEGEQRVNQPPMSIVHPRTHGRTPRTVETLIALTVRGLSRPKHRP